MQCLRDNAIQGAETAIAAVLDEITDRVEHIYNKSITEGYDKKDLAVELEKLLEDLG